MKKIVGLLCVLSLFVLVGCGEPVPVVELVIENVRDSQGDVSYKVVLPDITSESNQTLQYVDILLSGATTIVVDKETILLSGGKYTIEFDEEAQSPYNKQTVFLEKFIGEKSIGVDIIEFSRKMSDEEVKEYVYNEEDFTFYYDKDEGRMYPKGSLFYKYVGDIKYLNRDKVIEHCDMLIKDQKKSGNIYITSENSVNSTLLYKCDQSEKIGTFTVE